MKKQAEAIQYTVRGVPREVDRALRLKAARRRLSLNQAILEELALAATGGKQRADFSDVTGKWTRDAGFDKILASQRQIDPEKWK
jgi:hypothetical protein